MTTTTVLTEKLNTLRIAAGMSPLKSWKGSRAKLNEQIEKLEREAKKNKPAKAPKKASSDTITLADIARELDINPKVARAKMRRVTVPAGFEAERHTYYLERKQWVIDTLTTDMRKKQDD